MHGYAHTVLRTTVGCHPNPAAAPMSLYPAAHLSELNLNQTDPGTRKSHLMMSFLQLFLRLLLLMVTYLLMRTKKEISMQKTRTESGNKYFPAPCSITKTEMPVDPTSIGIPADPFLSPLPHLNPQYLLDSPCSQAFGKSFAFR